MLVRLLLLLEKTTQNISNIIESIKLTSKYYFMSCI